MDMNINILSDSEVQTLNEIIENAQNIVICCHKSPDGDALGSSLGWANFLTVCGKSPTIVVPDAYPDFLQWMPGANAIVRYDKHTEQATALLQNADLVFCLDFNGSDRVDEMKDALEASPAKKVMIDHHLDPKMQTVLTVSHPNMSSTSELVFRIIWQLGKFDDMPKECAVNIYCGMMTDTGGFTYNSTQPEIFFIISQLLTKGIDLSMAANLALTGMIVALLNAHNPGIPVVALLALATLLGLLMGMINGLLVWRLGIPAIVVTLGTMSIYRGIIFLLTDGGWVNSHQMSADFLSLPRSTLLGLPLLSWCAIAALLLVGYFLRYSRTGRALYTAGGNATAAYYTGINAGKMQFVSFCLSGALAGFCGYLWISRFAVAYVDVANGFELQVVAACVIGGISTMGGSGRVLGCLCGALFLGVINNALPVIGISPFWQMAISGAVIVMAVLLNERGNRGHGRLILRNAALARQKQAVKS